MDIKDIHPTPYFFVLAEKKSFENLRQLVEIFKEIKEESPSLDFTANLMAVLEKETTDIYKATPLISKKGWFFLGAILVASIFYGCSFIPNGEFDNLKTENKIDTVIVKKEPIFISVLFCK